MTGLMSSTSKKFHKAPHAPFAPKAAWFVSYATKYNDSNRYILT